VPAAAARGIGSLDDLEIIEARNEVAAARQGQRGRHERHDEGAAVGARGGRRWARASHGG